MAKTNLISRTANANTLKYISLLTLTLQNAILGLSMRYARTRPGEIFLSSTGARRCIVGIHPTPAHTPSHNAYATLEENYLNAYLIILGAQEVLVQLESTTKSRAHTLYTDKQYLQACCLLSLRMYVCACVWVREWFYDFD